MKDEMKDAAEYIGISCVILAICFGCSHCDKTNAEIKLMEMKAKQTEPIKVEPDK